MKTIYGLGKTFKEFEGAVVTLGIFDGLHLGHQHILKSMIKYAVKRKKKTVCVTFFPHPAKILSSKHIFLNIISLTHRLKLIEESGVDACLVINFNRRFARMGAKEFIDKLNKKIKPTAIFVGSNFTFGRGGAGNIKLLNKLAGGNNFRVEEARSLRLGGKVISSTLIRSLIKEGDLKSARRYLGRDISLLGTVVHGKRVGRKLGYHTANIDTEHEIMPPSGIYAVRIKMKGRNFIGVAYIGTSPTMHFHFIHPRLEVYIINFNKNIYDKQIEVEFKEKIRNEKEFASVTELARQIKKDVVNAKSILSCRP